MFLQHNQVAKLESPKAAIIGQSKSFKNFLASASQKFTDLEQTQARLVKAESLLEKFSETQTKVGCTDVTTTLNDHEQSV